jgi:hypothetical protein
MDPYISHHAPAPTVIFIRAPGENHARYSSLQHADGTRYPSPQHSGRNRVVATVRALAQLSVRPSEELQGALADAVLRSAASMDEAAAVAVLRALHGMGLGAHAAAWELRGRLDFQGVFEKM